MKLPTILILLLSFPVLLFGVVQCWKGIMAKWWPRFPTSDLKFKIIRSSFDDSEFWTPVVEGSYDIQGTSYKLNRIRFGDCGVSSEGEAQRMVEKYKSTPTSVYVNPSNPKEHVLFPGLTRRALLTVLIGLFLCIVAVLTEKGLLPVEGSWPAGL